MKRSALAPVLLMLLSTSCGEKPHPAALKPLTPDLARYDRCPASFPAAPALPALSSFKLPDGREVVLLDTVFARETVTARYLLQGREAWHQCESPVRYTEDWIRSVSK